MRGIRQDPCKGCGRTIEHDKDPFDAYCYLCEPKGSTEPASKLCAFIWGIVAGLWLGVLINWLYR